MNDHQRSRNFQPIAIVILIAGVIIGTLWLTEDKEAPEPEPAPKSTSNAQPKVTDTTPPRVKSVDENTILYRGVISDAISGPIDGAEVRSGPFKTADESLAFTDAQGSFEIFLPRGNKPIVRMEAPGYYQQVVELELDTEVPYLLFRGGIISGSVTGPVAVEDRTVAEAAVAGASIEFAGVEGWFHETKTDEAGRYSMTAPPGPLVLTVRSSDYSDQQILDLRAVREGETIRDIQFQPGCIVEVVLFGDNEVVTEARVRALTDFGIEADVISDSSGRATLTGLTYGSARIIVVCSGYQAQFHSMILGQNRPLIRRPINMKRSSPWSIEVVDTTGNPRPDAIVRISAERQELVSTTAGDRAGLDILGAGATYSVDVDAPNAARRRIQYRLPESGPAVLRVVLHEGGRFSGTVVDNQDRPVGGAGVLITPTNSDQGPPRLTTTALDGTFSTELFTPGGYRIQVQHPRLGRSMTETTIVDGKNQPLGKIVIQ